MFVNLLTVLGFIRTSKQEGNKAIVRIAAASQLGRMLGEAVQGGGYSSCEHRVNRTGKCRGIQRRVYRQRTGNDVGSAATGVHRHGCTSLVCSPLHVVRVSTMVF